MNRIEALRILGLDEDATIEDIKTAYKEMAQILHPDRFASSKKLEDRATEQFKNLQGAYDFLTSKANAQKSKGSTQRRAAGTAAYGESAQYEARLAGIAAARTQLVAQRDAILDERRNALIIAGVGVLVALLLRRVPIAMAIGTTGIVWGIIQFAGAQSRVGNLDEHIKKLNEEQKRIAQELDDLE